jgi:hypothetical protein
MQFRMQRQIITPALDEQRHDKNRQSRDCTFHSKVAGLKNSRSAA